METRGPHVRTIPVRHPPRKAPCPRCGTLGRRKAIHNRRVRTIAYKQAAFLDLTYGEYRGRCGCCARSRPTPQGVDPRALYDNKVRQAVLDRILDDGISAERVIASMRRDDLPDLSDGFVWLSRRGNRGPERKPGRPKARGLTNKEKSAFIFKHRWLIVRRLDTMNDRERAELAMMLGYLPELKPPRAFVDRLGMLFEEGQSERTAWSRHAALVADGSFLAVPELDRAIEALAAEKFAKMIAFLRSPA